MKKIRLEFQYFEDCPNYRTMRNNLVDALRGIEHTVELTNVVVDDAQTAERVNFRGSPTLLINGEDVEGMPSPEHPFVACRYYAQGVPSAEAIRSRIEQYHQKG